MLLKATGTPIDRYSYDTVETLRDIQSRWAALREVRDEVEPEHPRKECIEPGGELRPVGEGYEDVAANGDDHDEHGEAEAGPFSERYVFPDAAPLHLQ